MEKHLLYFIRSNRVKMPSTDSVIRGMKCQHGYIKFNVSLKYLCNIR